MALTERTEEDKIEVVGTFKHVQVRTATVIERGGNEISRTYHRHVLSPNDTLRVNQPRSKRYATRHGRKRLRMRGPRT